MEQELQGENREMYVSKFHKRPTSNPISLHDIDIGGPTFLKLCRYLGHPSKLDLSVYHENLPQKCREYVRTSPHLKSLTDHSLNPNRCFYLLDENQSIMEFHSRHLVNMLGYRFPHRLTHLTITLYSQESDTVKHFSLLRTWFILTVT